MAQFTQRTVQSKHRPTGSPNSWAGGAGGRGAADAKASLSLGQRGDRGELQQERDRSDSKETRPCKPGALSIESLSPPSPTRPGFNPASTVGQALQWFPRTLRRNSDSSAQPTGLVELSASPHNTPGHPCPRTSAPALASACRASLSGLPSAGPCTSVPSSRRPSLTTLSLFIISAPVFI